jgi:hypothetical protein
MKLVMNDDRAFQGTPLQIVRAMQDISFGAEALTVRKYIESIVDAAQRIEGVTLAATGTTDAELATSLIDEMIRTGVGAARVDSPQDELTDGQEPGRRG